MRLDNGKLTSPSKIHTLLAQYQLKPRKSLGQNFLADENILRKIFAAGQIAPRDLVLEIGPGLGALTEVLAKQAGQVVAVEYDRELYRVLQDTLGAFPNLHLVNQDILKFDLATLRERSGFQYKVIANLPYYITTPTLFLLLEAGIKWDLMVFLLQKEVADRLVAGPGVKEYGALTVMVRYYGQVEKVAMVPRTVFYPVPKVDSTIIRIIPENRPPNLNEYRHLRRLVQAAFGQRRKTIVNALTSINEFTDNRNMLADQLSLLGIDPARRGETLSQDEFLQLTQKLGPAMTDMKETL